MLTDYKTVKAYAEGSFVEKKSKFIGHIMPVQTEQEALDFIHTINKKHFDAKHNVFAYILKEGQIRRYSDNGEPQGTAGIPTLDVLQKEGLTDVCVVVTRYFGGVLLGGGGLVRAYSHSTKLAVDNAQILNMVICKEVSIKCEYSFYGKLSYILPNYGVVVKSSDFGSEVTLNIIIRSDCYDKFLKEITELSNGQVAPNIIGESYQDM